MDADIKKFIETFSTTHNVHVTAAVLFGSSLYKKYEDIYDIDLLLILEEDSVFRGNYYISNLKRVDYFSGSISLLQRQLQQSRGTTDTLLFNILGKGTVLFGQDTVTDLVAEATDYLTTFSGYTDKENILKILWYRLTDAQDDLFTETDPMVKNLLLAQVISLSMEFYLMYHGELVEKKGTSTRGEFYTLHSTLLASEDSKSKVKELMNFLSKETGFKENDNWEVQYR